MSSELEQSLKAASQWYALLASGQATEADVANWNAWRNADPGHQQAWQRVEALTQKLDELPGNVTSEVLQLHSPDRRRAIKHLAVLCGVGVTAAWAYKAQPWREMLADYVTAAGEVREVRLPDGSVMFVNTASAVDVRFSQQERLIVLIKGEVFVHTAHETGQPYRPLLVATRHGKARALGTKFNVRDYASYTKVMVVEGAVMVTPGQAPDAQVTVQAGQSITFDGNASGTVRQEEFSTAWTKGMLVVYSMPLGDFLQELGRYHRGVLRCDPAVAHLPISGSFQVADVHAVLRHLTQVLPVRVERFTSYWVTVRAV